MVKQSTEKGIMMKEKVNGAKNPGITQYGMWDVRGGLPHLQGVRRVFIKKFIAHFKQLGCERLESSALVDVAPFDETPKNK